MAEDNFIKEQGPDALEQRAAAVEHLFDAVVVTDLEGVVIDWNPGAERLYGWAREEILGRPVSVLHVPEDVDRITDDVLTTIAVKGRWHGEIKMLHRTGRIAFIESIVAPVLDPDGKMIGAIGVNRDLSARIESERRLEHMALHDQLTGLANRTLAIQKLGNAVAAADGHGRVAAVYLNLDSFRRVNEDLGHTAGDAVLKEVARRLVDVVGSDGTVARIGGDEFLVVAEYRNGSGEIDSLVESVGEALAEPHYVGAGKRVVTASIGVAICPDHARDADGLLTRSNDAMFRHRHDHRTPRGENE